jgi:hypothetical protein
VWHRRYLSSSARTGRNTSAQRSPHPDQCIIPETCPHRRRRTLSSLSRWSLVDRVPGRRCPQTTTGPIAPRPTLRSRSPGDHTVGPHSKRNPSTDRIGRDLEILQLQAMPTALRLRVSLCCHRPPGVRDRRAIHPRHRLPAGASSSRTRQKRSRKSCCPSRTASRW